MDFQEGCSSEDPYHSMELKPCRCIINCPYPRAYPTKCCQPIVKKKKITEKYKDGELHRQIEEEYIAEYCSPKKECVELKYPPQRLPRFSSLPKYLRIDDEDDESDDHGDKDCLLWQLDISPKRHSKCDSESWKKYFS